MASRSVDCGDVATYLEEIDTRMAEALLVVISDPEWAPAAQLALEAIEESDGDVGNFTIEEVQPLLTYLGVSGEVLTSVDPADVPESVRDLHESATEYWVMTVEMVEAVFADGPGAASDYTEDLDAISTRNLSAQEELHAGCADALAPYEERETELDTFFDVLDGDSNLSVFAEATLDDLAGAGYVTLFFADEPARGVPATVSQPVIATPED
jgi:hypothetical protein